MAAAATQANQVVPLEKSALAMATYGGTDAGPGWMFHDRRRRIAVSADRRVLDRSAAS
jgi:hypothetical protein